MRLPSIIFTSGRDSLLVFSVRMVILSLFGAAHAVAQNADQTSQLQLCADMRANLCDNSESTFECLLSQQESLGQCCAVKMRDILGSGVTEKPIDYKGVTLPAGTSLMINNFCEYTTATTTQPMQYQSIGLAPGSVIFDSDGNVGLAQLAGERQLHDLPLAVDQPVTLFFENGTPKSVRLKTAAIQHGISFEPMAELEDQFARNQELSKIPVEFLHQLIIASSKSYDPGTTRLHSNGRVALGRVKAPVTVNGMPIAPGITAFAENGDVLSGTLSGQYEHEGWSLTNGDIKFSSNGELYKAVLAEDAMLNQWRVNSPSQITMSHAGAPRSLLLGSADSSSNHHDTVKVDSLWLGRSVVYRLLPNGQIEIVRLQDHSWYRGRMYPKGTSMTFDENGEVSWDSFYDKFLVQAANGKVRENEIPDILPTAEVRRGFLLPAGSLVYPMTPRGDQKFVVRHPFNYKGFRFSAGEFLVSRENTIRTAALDGHQLLNGLKLKGYPFTVNLDSAGNLRSGFLAGDQMYNNLLLKGSMFRTEFGASGELLSGTLARDTLINGVSYAAQHPIKFGTGGQVRSGKISVAHSRDNLVFKAGTHLKLDSNGDIASGTLAEETLIGLVEIPADSFIKFSHGDILTAKTDQLITMGKLRFYGDEFSFRRDGLVHSGLLSQDAVISGNTLSAGTRVALTATGKLLANQFVGLPYLPNREVATLMVGAEVPITMPVQTSSSCKQTLDSAMQVRGYWLHYQHIRECLLMHAELD